MKNSEKKFLIPVPDNIKLRLYSRVRLINIQRIYVISILGLFFFFLIMFVDYLRYSSGKIIPGSIYFWLFLNHLCFFFFLIPILVIRFNRKAFDENRFKHAQLFIQIWAVYLGVMLVTIAVLSYIERESMILYIIYIIIANFGLLLAHKERFFLNFASFLGIGIACGVIYQSSLESSIIIFLEILGVTIPSFIASTQIFNAKIKEVHSEKLLEDKNAQIAKEKNRGDELLYNILPEDIANELKTNGFVEPRQYNSASIMLIDIKGFSKISKLLSPRQLIKELDYCFKNFDKIIVQYNLEKIKTIGDAYLCIGGVPNRNENHAINCVGAAKEMLIFLNEWKIEQRNQGKLFFECRIGIHTGPVIAGVVGEKKFAFDIWGDTVNTAERIETNGEVGKINISQTTFLLVKDKYPCTHRGKIPVKNMEPLNMYFVDLV